MTIKNNNWTGGTIGGLITGSTGAGDDIFDSQSATFPKYATVNGETVAQIDGPTLGAGQGMLRRIISTSKIKFRQVFTISALPASPLFLERVEYNNATTLAFDVEVKSSGKIGLSIAGGADVWLSTPTLTPGTEYRVEVYADAGSSATTGSIRVTLFQGRYSSTIIADSTLLTGVNLAAATGLFTTARRGKWDSSAYAGVYNILPGLRQADGVDAVNAVDPVPSPYTLTGDVTPADHTVGKQQTLTLTAGGFTPTSYSGVWDGVAFGPQASNVVVHTDDPARAGATINWSATATG